MKPPYGGSIIEHVQSLKGQLVNKYKFKFETDEEAESFCNQIVERTVSLFNMSAEEAVARINRQWAGLPFVGSDVIYHDTAEDWAKDIYWGHESFWWIQGEERQRRNLPPLTPKPLTESE